MPLVVASPVERDDRYRVLSDPQSLRRSPDPCVKNAHKRRMRPEPGGASGATRGSGRPAASRAFLACSGPNSTNGSSLARLSAATVLRLAGSSGAWAARERAAVEPFLSRESSRACRSHSPESGPFRGVEARYSEPMGTAGRSSGRGSCARRHSRRRAPARAHRRLGAGSAPRRERACAVAGVAHDEFYPSA